MSTLFHHLGYALGAVAVAAGSLLTTIIVLAGYLLWVGWREEQNQPTIRP